MKKRLTLTPLESKRAGTYMFLLCFIFYFVVYFGRLNYSAALAEITTTGFMEKDAAGLISTAFFVTYGLGQLVNGFISDKMPPFGLVTLGIALSAVMNLLMYVSVKAGAGFAVYIVCWALNGYVQSVIWPTMIRIVSTVLPDEIRVSAGVSMLATTAVGTVLSYVLSSAIMRVASWRECFLIPGIILAFGAVVWFIATRPISVKTVSCAEPEPPSETHPGLKSRESEPLIPLMLASGAFIMLIPIAMYSIVKDGITTWTPTIITELFATEPYLATLLTTVIPLISIFGAALSKLVMEKWLHDELKSTAFLFAVGIISFVLMLTIGESSLVLMLALLAIIITCMLGINTMLISLVPLRFGKYGRAATMTGVLNSTAAICCGISTYVVGLLAKAAGWTVVFTIFLVLCAVGLSVSLALVRRWMEFKRR